MAGAYMLSDGVVSAWADPEGLGRTVGEAQAMGRPVVGSDHGGAREQIIAERTVFLFPSGDSTALAGGLRKALSLAPDSRARLPDEALPRVRSAFSNALISHRTIGIYPALLRTVA